MVKDWLVMRTQSRQERIVEHNLAERNITHYLPTKRETRQWKDRKKSLELPLFPGYIFVQPEAGHFPYLKYIRGSCGLVVFNNRPASLQESEVDRIRRVAGSGLSLEIHPNLQTGERVVIASGPLMGLEGELIRIKNRNRLVINAYILGQSVSLEIGIDEVEKPKGR
jgi:transcription antitermination factor NusG